MTLLYQLTKKSLDWFLLRNTTRALSTGVNHRISISENENKTNVKANLYTTNIWQMIINYVQSYIYYQTVLKLYFITCAGERIWLNGIECAFRKDIFPVQWCIC